MSDRFVCMNSKREQIARALRTLRREKSTKEDRDIKPEEVANVIGVPVQSIKNWETGRHAIKFEDAWALADYYGASLDAICNRN